LTKLFSFAPIEIVLKKRISVKIQFILIGLLFASSHFLGAEQMNFFGFFDSIFSYIQSYQKYIIKKEFSVSQPKQTIAVSLSTDLQTQENIFLKNRFKKVTEVLINEFQIDAPLKIGFCLSGGGNRAMIGSLGLLSAAAQTKFLDATLYLAGVSGSTWTIIPYVCQQAILRKNSMQAVVDLEQYFSSALSSGIHFCYENHCTMGLLPLTQYDEFFKDLMKRYAYNQDISLINLYGPLVANQSLGFLGDRALEICWSDFANEVLLGTTPLPICTAAFKDNSDDYAYFEMSPFESGNKLLGYIPTQYLGSPFKNGILDIDNICPEQSIAFYMGVYGSAFAVVAQEVYNSQITKNRSIDPLLFLFEPSAIKKYNPYKSWNLFAEFSITSKIQNIIKSLCAQSSDNIYAFVHNYNPQAVGGKNNLGIFDAGIGCNFPISVFLDRPERTMDLIILYDSNNGSSDVKKVYDYALANGIPFDIRMKQLSVDELGKKSMIVFNDPRSCEYVPYSATILYFPTQGIDIDEPPYTTFNFKYEMNDVKKLKDTMHDAFISNFEIIRNIMKLLTDKYKKF
jgi:hypothetical protein